MRTRINHLLLLLFIAMTTMAQTKSFTLEDLLPGGNSWHSLRPQTIYTMWWGDVCINTEIEACLRIDAKTGRKDTLFTLKQLQDWTKGQTAREVAVRHCYNLTFPYADQPLVRVATPTEHLLVDFQKGATVWKQPLERGRTATDWNAASRHLAFTKDYNLYVTTADGQTQAVSTDGSNDLVYGSSVHRDEFGISKGTFWSPDGTKLAYYRMDQSMVPDYPQVDISTRIATTMPCKYPMAGEKSHEVTIGIYNPATQKTTWLATDDPEFYYLTNISWAPDGKHIYVFEVSRDQKSMALCRYNAETGSRERICYREKHPKYVEPMTGLSFLSWDADKALFQSQRDGYNHLYEINLAAEPELTEWTTTADGGSYTAQPNVKQVTKGEWVVLDLLGFCPKTKSVIIRSNEASPIQANLYAFKLATPAKRTLLGSGEGVHNGTLSAHGTYVLDRYSAPQVPASINLLATKTGKGINLVTAANPWADFKVPEIVSGSIKAADGKTDLYYRMVKPVDFDSTKVYPTIVYVYGGPHAHMVEAGWNYLTRGWEVYIAQKGYLIFVLDNRGSQHRGRDFENVTYGHLGREEMADQMQGVKFLKSLPYVDANRIGVHGWSFGGFMTTNLMLTHPDVFKVGVAGGPVIDWNYYEVMYGERYMSTPQANPEGYKESNLRLRAKDLQGKLQIIIGYNDPVCVPQHALSFLRAAADAGKQVDFFAYPGGEHNMFGRDQVHLHERISQYFDDYLK